MKKNNFTIDNNFFILLIRKTQKFKFLYIFLFGLNFPLFSQHFNFKNISIDKGLQSSFVYKTLEDKNGLLWILTEKGVSTYDGVFFNHFNEQDGLTENGFYNILKDSNNLIWLISKNFKLFYYENKTFRNVKAIEEICWMDFDDTGKLWFLSRDGSLYSISSNKELEIYNKSKYLGVYYSFKSLPNKEFVLCNEKGVFILKNDKSIKKLKIDVDVIKYKIVPRCYLKSNNSLLISTKAGIFELKQDNDNPKLVYKLKDNQIFTFFEDSFSKDIWIGSLKGVFKFKNGVFSDKLTSKYLSDNIVLDINKFKESEWWFCTSENGVYNCNLKAKHFDITDGIKRNSISFIKSNNNTIYTFSLNGSVSAIVKKDYEWFVPNLKILNNTNLSSVNNVYQTIKEGVIIASTKLIQIKNNKTEQFKVKNYPYESIHVFPQNDINSFYFLSKSKLWKGFKEPKSLFFNMKVWDIAKKYKSQFAPIWFVENDSFHRMIFVVENGLMNFKYNVKSLSFKKINFPYKIQDVWMTNNNSLIIGTLDKGLCILKNNIQKFYSTDDGLLSNYCTKTYYINNKIWICSNKGVSRLELDKNDSLVAISNFTSNDLLIYNEVNDLLVHKGDVYVATNKGVSVFPENIKLSTIKPKVFIENVTINNKNKSISNEYNLLYTENNVVIQYKSISFRSANNIFYKYKIVGNNDSSLVTTKSDRIQLSSLSPGTYVFTVWARNIDGVWSNEPAKIVFIINPPFWQTWWFYLAVLLLITTVIFLIIRNRIKVFKVKSETEKRIIDAELKAIRLHMNPHFIFNTLSSLQYYIIYNKNKEAGKYLSTFSILLRLIMKYAKQNEIYLKEEIELLDKYVELEQMRFENKIDYTLNVNDDLLYHLIPPLILQPFVENAIKYGISNIKGKGKLEINIFKENTFLVCTIQDNGIGRAKSELLKDDENLKFESTGIKYTRERLRLLSNQKDGENLVVITDLYENNIAKGTIVKINIPIN